LRDATMASPMARVWLFSAIWCRPWRSISPSPKRTSCLPPTLTFSFIAFHTHHPFDADDSHISRAIGSCSPSPSPSLASTLTLTATATATGAHTPPYHAHLLHPWPVAFAASVDPLFERHARNNAPKGRVGGKIAGKRLGLLRRVPVQDLGVGVWGRGFGVSGSGLSALASCVASLLRV
jgi:hypothetical protein